MEGTGLIVKLHCEQSDITNSHEKNRSNPGNIVSSTCQLLDRKPLLRLPVSSETHVCKMVKLESQSLRPTVEKHVLYNCSVC